MSRASWEEHRGGIWFADLTLRKNRYSLLVEQDVEQFHASVCVTTSDEYRDAGTFSSLKDAKSGAIALASKIDGLSNKKGPVGPSRC